MNSHSSENGVRRGNYPPDKNLDFVLMYGPLDSGLTRIIQRRCRETLQH